MFVSPLFLYPATPGWRVWSGCVCSGSCYGCALPLLAGLFGCVCVPVPAPLVPRHSWLGCVVCVCVFGLGLRLRPATPGWGVGVCVCSCARSTCTPPLLAGVCGVGVCLGLGFGCAPPNLAGVLGGVCVRVPAPLVPRHSWLGCAAWLCVLGLWFQLRPATPGLGVGVCVCWCARSACTPPLLAGVCGVGVCAPARVSAAPRHSWLGCWGVCIFLCPLPVYPATPGWGVWFVCVCLGSGCGCAPPLLAGMLGCVCVRVPAPLVPRQSWRGCALWVCLLGLGFRLRPATPGWVVGECVCLCARSSRTPPILAGVCVAWVCVWDRVSAAPRHSCLGFWGVCVFVYPLRLFPATPRWGVWCVCVCLGSGFSCAPPLLAGVLGCVCVRVPAPLVLATPGGAVRCGGVCLGSGFGCALPLLAGVLGCVCVCVTAPLVPRHSWLGCVAWVCVWARVLAAPRHSWLGCWGVCVFVCPLRLYTATPGWGVGQRGCVCLGFGFGCARHSWLGCWGVCVFVCPLRLFPATPGWGLWCVCVCLGSGFGCAPPLLAGVLGGVCVRGPAPLVPRHSWLGCWGGCVCVIRLGFWLRPATPGWDLGVCVCSCARSAFSPPLLAGVCGAGVCAWARISAAPGHSWQGCSGVCVCSCARSA